MDYFWTVCSRCGAGHGMEDFTRQDPDKHRPLDIQKLPEGAEENHIRTIWTPVCNRCGHDQFHIQLDPEDMIEFWEGMHDAGTLVSVDQPLDVDRHLSTWKRRRRQEEEEFEAWRRERNKRH